MLRVEGLRASFADAPLAAEATVEAGFGRWRIAAPPSDGPVLVEYTVRPGAEEQAKMAGPTGYRFGHLDAVFGLFAGRQVFLFPAEPRPPSAFRVVFTLPAGWDVVAPWPREAAGAFRLEGPGASARLLRAVLGAGEFETAAAPVRAASGGGAQEPSGFRVHLLSSLPPDVRARAVERALALEDFLARRLGRPGRAYDLILVPRTASGSYVSVAPAPEGFGLSLGDGLPTRWLSIARALGRACLDDRLEALAENAPARPILEALPTWLAVDFSRHDGWRPAQVWLEQFYYNS
ncbi:MAG TPA: hypothetical protein VFX28_17435, partial [Methylomirabilota bacterium]|nr:hypothetical protein [Methylomirabilota bacterium]